MLESVLVSSECEHGLTMVKNVSVKKLWCVWSGEMCWEMCCCLKNWM